MYEKMHDENLDFYVEEDFGTPEEIVKIIISEVREMKEKYFTICSEAPHFIHILEEFDKQGAKIQGMIKIEKHVKENGICKVITYPAVFMKLRERICRTV
ncbi:MAG: hypothetical protein IJQ99_03035 [Synergistaceae bacterium]|nr:hypothetical protein [Synergistaceae bacterium]